MINQKLLFLVYISLTDLNSLTRLMFLILVYELIHIYLLIFISAIFLPKLPRELVFFPWIFITLPCKVFITYSTTKSSTISPVLNLTHISTFTIHHLRRVIQPPSFNNRQTLVKIFGLHTSTDI